MFKKLSIAGAAIVMGAVALPASASAAPTGVAVAPIENSFGGFASNLTAFDGTAEYQRHRRDRYYDGRGGRYYDDRRGRRTPQRCSSTEGTVIGAVAGGLLGNTVAGRGNRLLGTIIGGGAGALAGREIDRGGQPRGCERFRR